MIVGDFGLATLPSCRTNDEVRGTLSYMAPEVVQCYQQGTAYDTLSADVWSLGALLFVMLTGNNAFGPNHASRKDWYFVQISKGNWSNFWAEHEKYSSPVSAGAKTFLQRCMTVGIVSRPTAAELINDDWFTYGMLNEAQYSARMTSIKEGMDQKMAV
jgi:serine/threonine protein kinase